MSNGLHPIVARLLPHWQVGHWYEREAALAILRGHFQQIASRDGRDLYLVRCWVTTPQIGEDGRWDSADSLMLHFFVTGDMDGALHDHPWQFESVILSGGYVEQLPDEVWFDGDRVLGPAFLSLDTHIEGDEIHHDATDLHRILSVQNETWTLVRTGSRVREWGFHPEGSSWIGWSEYLAARGVA